MWYEEWLFCWLQNLTRQIFILNYPAVHKSRCRPQGGIHKMLFQILSSDTPMKYLQTQNPAKQSREI